jgi:hypothetical protein
MKEETKTKKGPKRYFTAVALGACWLCVGSATVRAGNSVVVQSKELALGASSNIGIAISNDVSLRELCIPLIVREIDPGTFVISLTPRRNPGGRLSTVLTGINLIATYPNPDGTCKEGQPGGFKTSGPINAVSPEGVVFQLGNLLPTDPPLAAGADPRTGSLQLQLISSSVPGQFEIDSTCIDPSSHLIFVQDVTNLSIVPAFTKGIVSVFPDPFCDCHSHGDVNDDRVLDVFDIVGLIEYVFGSGTQPPVDLYCENIDRGDVNCTDSDDVFDVVYLIDHVFSGGLAPCCLCENSIYWWNCP